jgi:hypothetical protein
LHFSHCESAGSKDLVTLQKDVTANPRGGEMKVASNLPRERLSEDMMQDQVVESIAVPERKGPLEILPRWWCNAALSQSEEGVSKFATAWALGAPTTAKTAPSTSAPVGVAVGASVGCVICFVMLDVMFPHRFLFTITS